MRGGSQRIGEGLALSDRLRRGSGEERRNIVREIYLFFFDLQQSGRDVRWSLQSLLEVTAIMIFVVVQSGAEPRSYE